MLTNKELEAENLVSLLKFIHAYTDNRKYKDIFILFFTLLFSSATRICVDSTTSSA